MSRISTALFASVLCVAHGASALEQPGGATIPTEPGCHGGMPTGLAATFACVCEDAGECNIGEVCTSESSCDDGQNSRCETTMWHSYNDNTCIPSNMSGLDPREEASTTPETFSPVCPLTFTVVTRGTALFQDAFGWYNVTGSEPATSDLHVMLECSAGPGDSAILDIRHHPDYAGGEVGFFLVTPESSSGSSCAGGDCCATVARAAAGEGRIYYSQTRFNPDQAGADSVIHLLTYDSHLWDHTFYFAWEDIFGGSNNDFTDLVTSVSGVECAGGGARCDTGAEGVCSHGVTRCEGEELECMGLYTAGEERCDGLDNDCNGEIDNGADCERDKDICHNGRCVPHCRLSDEFTCDEGFYCDEETGFCVEAACDEVTCGEGMICQGGQCVGGCEGVTCPHGQSCRLGACVDPCEGVGCASPDVCSEGICVPGCGDCNGLICHPPLECDTGSGHCVDLSCAEECPAGTHCEEGACVDSCIGAVCPPSQECVDGACQDRSGSGGDGGVGPADGGPDSGDSGSDGDTSGDGATSGPDTARAGCNCQAAPRAAGSNLALVLAMLLTAAAILRRR